MLKEVCGRRGVSGGDLASQATLSRFEGGVTAREAVGMGRALEEFVVGHHSRRLRGRARRITIDLDPTEDKTYGQQSFSFFNGHYDSWCFLPQLGFLTFDDEKEQHLFHARLRPGNSRCWRGALGLLRRTVARLRAAFPGAKVRVRLDAGFACPRTFEVLEELGVEYVVAMAGNARLDRLAEPLLARARRWATGIGESARVFGAFRYAPLKDAWPHERRVVVKAEVVVHPGRDPRDNPRYVVTNLRLAPESVYSGVYCGRGDVENRIKELNLGLTLGRTSCARFVSNQLRVLMTAAAYVLFQELRRAARGTSLAQAQVPTLRERLLKIGARAVESVRRLVLHFPAACPWRESWLSIARAVAVT
ncbi:MAG: IS1380 family transposase [Planctomycetes bacterium]|nr:IS1380 family transposase [Planctomycetota bacterium]